MRRTERLTYRLKDGHIDTAATIEILFIYRRREKKNLVKYRSTFQAKIYVYVCHEMIPRNECSNGQTSTAIAAVFCGCSKQVKFIYFLFPFQK